MKYLVLIARLFLGGLFIYASLYKIIDPESFAQSIRNYQLLPPETTNVVALTLPWIEFIAGALLILGVETKPAALVIVGMLAAFSVGLIRAWWIGLNIDCGCFSATESGTGDITPLTIVRDSSLILVGLLILFGDKGRFALRPGPSSSA